MDYSPLTSTVAESLISYDAEMVSHSTDMFYAFTASLTSTVLAMTILYHLLGWPSLFGIMVLAALTPMPAIISKRVSRLHREVMHATDARIAKISECLQGIRTLKYFAWEPMMFAKVDSIRLSEQQRIWKRNITSMFVPLVGDMMSLLSLTVVFTALLLVTNRPLRAPVAFTSLSIMETLRGQYVWLSKVVQCVAQARESAQRLDLFLESGTEKQRGAPGPPAFANATFRMPGSSGFKLSNITIYFEEKALNVVTGAMGSGKTMLLLSLLGETTRDSGQVTCPVDVAFVPQTAWLQSGSIRQNIVFYSHYEETRYNEVLHACDLVNDLTLLPDGDRTAVGEKGSNLSGGQKQRISLARAVYSTASTLLLDDVFSALDAQTTAKVYKRCFRSGILGDRTVILATQLRQIINRFGPDMQSLDAVLVDWLRMTLDNGLRFLLRVASVASIMPIFALPAALCCSLGFCAGELYSRTEISVKRLVAINFSPVLSLFGEAAAGVAVIRGHRGVDAIFRQRLADRLAAHMRASEAQFNCNRWVSVRSDFCAATIAGAAGAIAYLRGGSSGLVGLSLTNAIGLSQTILTLVRNMNELEVELSSFQRISEYTNIEQEEPEQPLHVAPFVPNVDNVPATWPTAGCVEFQNATIRYTAEGPMVLRGVTFVAKPGERVAIVGRTGSGKSTLGLSLLRVTQIVSGKVLIDGVDVREVSLARLRTSICFIAQDTQLFTGDIKANIDPFGNMGDDKAQAIVATCNIASSNDGGGASKVQSLSTRTPVIDGGSKFSSGQRQILGLARAFCRQSRVVILDEPTALVDRDTDLRMQELLRSQLASSTVITIAHRLRSIMDYDRIIVMGDGMVIEWVAVLPPSIEATLNLLASTNTRVEQEWVTVRSDSVRGSVLEHDSAYRGV
ncbi:ABC transporter [Purpureocillium lilacinum]|uniref:ABC transporter n=1 Tax=Purpureocillium lilacinum TaxID=33203 RepID=A0A179FVF1_PURLI|nr:ABC transporter [Purpureocillium lilacinum]OAQ69592.1 ABC transporter [Purpureocillium lilacinum]